MSHREFYFKFGCDIYSEKSTSFAIYNELWHSRQMFLLALFELVRQLLNQRYLNFARRFEQEDY